MVTDAVMVNFRIPAQTRKRLRIALLEEGTTVQEFFTHLIEQKLERVQGESATATAEVDGESNEE